MKKMLFVSFFAACFAAEMYGQAIERLSAQYLHFDSTEGFTTLGATTGGGGGTTIYSHAVFVPILSGAPVLYVSFAAQADTHGGVAELVSCNIDGVLLCNAGTGGAGGAPTGWVNASAHFRYAATYCNGAACGLTGGDGGGGTGDEHDNTLYAHWCVHVAPGAHKVNLKIAVNHPGTLAGVTNFAFFEAAHVFIDASQPPPGSDCTKGSPTGPTPPPGEPAPSN